MGTKVRGLQDAVNEFVNRIHQRDPGARIMSGQDMVVNSEEKIENTITIQSSNGQISKYSVWQCSDGTVGGSTWI